LKPHLPTSQTYSNRRLLNRLRRVVERADEVTLDRIEEKLSAIENGGLRIRTYRARKRRILQHAALFVLTIGALTVGAYHDHLYDDFDAEVGHPTACLQSLRWFHHRSHERAVR